MQTPFEQAWLILKQGVSPIGSDSPLSGRFPPRIDPTQGASQYSQRGLMDAAYAGRGTPSPPRDTSLDEFTEELQLDARPPPRSVQGVYSPIHQQAYEAKLPLGGHPTGQTTYQDMHKIPPHLLEEAFPLPTEFGGRNIDEDLKFYRQHGLPPEGYNQYIHPSNYDSELHEGAAHNLEDMINQFG